MKFRLAFLFLWLSAPAQARDGQSSPARPTCLVKYHALGTTVDPISAMNPGRIGLVRLLTAVGIGKQVRSGAGALAENSPVSSWFELYLELRSPSPGSSSQSFSRAVQINAFANTYGREHVLNELRKKAEAFGQEKGCSTVRLEQGGPSA